MPTDPEQPFTLAFVGYSPADLADRAGAYEDAVLPLLDEHGARVLYRGRRAGGQDDTLPLEVHLLWFPHTRAFDAYISDDRRAALLEQFGETFTVKHVVELDEVSALSE